MEDEVCTLQQTHALDLVFSLRTLHEAPGIIEFSLNRYMRLR